MSYLTLKVHAVDDYDYTFYFPATVHEATTRYRNQISEFLQNQIPPTHIDPNAQFGRPTNAPRNFNPANHQDLGNNLYF